MPEHVMHRPPRLTHTYRNRVRVRVCVIWVPPVSVCLSVCLSRCLCAPVRCCLRLEGCLAGCWGGFD